MIINANTHFKIADYILETITSGDWTLEKWASGKAVLKGNNVTSTSVNTAHGNGYKSEDIIITQELLTQFKTIKNLKVYTNPTGYPQNAQAKSYSVTNSTIIYFIWTTVAASSHSVNVGIDVEGRWQ